MPALLSSRVFLYPKSGKFPTESALLELNPDNTVRLTTVDPNSGTRRSVMFDDSLTDLQVGGTGTSLTFTASGNRWRVDFSPYNAGQRVITVEQANREIFKSSDAGSWAAKLRELGYPTTYRSTSGRPEIIGFVVALVVLGAIATFLFVLRQHPFSGGY